MHVYKDSREAWTAGGLPTLECFGHKNRNVETDEYRIAVTTDGKFGGYP
jgi:hypothetical protein